MRLEVASVQFIYKCLQANLATVVCPGTQFDIAVVTSVYSSTALYLHGSWWNVVYLATGVHNHVCVCDILVDAEKH